MNRDYPSSGAEHEVKYAALLLAEANAAGTDADYDLRERLLVALLTVHGVVSNDEAAFTGFSFDGWPDEGSPEFYHHVGVHIEGKEVFDIKCDYDSRTPEVRNETPPPYVSWPRRPGKTTIQEDLIIERATAILLSRLRKPGAAIGSPAELKQYVGLHLACRENETFCAVWLDAQHCVIGEFDILFHGSLTQTSVYPRVVARRALELNAAAVVFCHNHPSGLPEPSRADVMLTDTLTRSLSLFDVRVIDHIVVGGPEPSQMVSFAERGLL